MAANKDKLSIHFWVLTRIGTPVPWGPACMYWIYKSVIGHHDCSYHSKFKAGPELHFLGVCPNGHISGTVSYDMYQTVRLVLNNYLKIWKLAKSWTNDKGILENKSIDLKAINQVQSYAISIIFTWYSLFQYVFWIDHEILVDIQISLHPNKQLLCHSGDELASLLWY